MLAIHHAPGRTAGWHTGKAGHSLTQNRWEATLRLQLSPPYGCLQLLCAKRLLRWWWRQDAERVPCSDSSAFFSP